MTDSGGATVYKKQVIMKCCGNCTVCTIDVPDRLVCCQVQTLRNVVEIKGLLKEMSVKSSNEDVLGALALAEEVQSV